MLFIAGASAIGAAYMVRRTMDVAHPTVKKPSIPQIEILVVRRAISAGETVGLKDLRWQSWPGDAVPSHALTRRAGTSSHPFTNALARFPLIEGEPLAETKLVRPGEGGFAAALITPGMRAVAVPVKEESAAGGLIQPNDRVDILWTQRASDSRTARPVTRSILKGVKVLAIGSSLEGRQERGTSRTVTLELTPKQSRIVESAKAGGEISLALLPVTDLTALTDDQASDGWDLDVKTTIKIMKFGR